MVLLCVIPIVLWARALPLGTRFSDATSTLTSLGVVCALAGITSFALNLVLGGRFGLIGRFFGGLPRMYAAHQINGRVAYLLLVAHACFITASRATISPDTALGLFTGRAGWVVTVGVAALVCMSISIFLTLYSHANHELFVYIQRSFGAIFLIGALHAFMTPGTKAFSSVLTYYLAGVALLGVCGWIYRSLFDDVLVRRREYRVSHTQALDAAVMEITMAPKSEPLDFTPGQFVYVSFLSRAMTERLRPITIVSEGPTEVVTFRAGGIRHQFHPFSITSASGQRQLKVTVKAVGDYTAAMRLLEEGAEARVEGPYGSFSYLNVRNPHQVWIAGGIGVTPFVSMARSLGPSEHDIDLYYAVKSSDDGYFADEFRRIGERYGNLRVIMVPEDVFGFVSADYVAESSGGLTDKDIFICGPPIMIDSLRSQFAAKGVPHGRLHYELFGFVR
ncbi:MAG: ferredoxin reductase family protein [Actinobacteria bacterium]|nr:ferredoxin reductase family protein [Actinomycetota bacterium]